MGSKVFVIDGGGRGHALVWKLVQSAKVGKVFIAPGNAGTASMGENIDFQIDEIFDLAKFAEKNADYTIVGSETPLSLGIGDIFRARDLPIFGPTKAAARIEWSKAFAKVFMSDFGLRISTASFQVFSDFLKAKKYVSNTPKPVVLKADSLTAGKGVFVCSNNIEALEVLERLMIRETTGKKSGTVVIEEFLSGEEASIHALTDHHSYLMFPPARDHKPVFNGNKGPNTGGMGVIAPVLQTREDLLRNIKYNIVESALAGLKRMGIPFTGCLYPGLMITQDGPKVLEFNARFGDPETQAFIRLLKSDFFELIKSCIESNLAEQKVEWHQKFAICVVLASGGYPGEYKTGFPISGIREVEKNTDVIVFHAGTKLDETGSLVTAGGRVLSVTAVGDSLQEARGRAYEAIKLIHFEGMHYRTDIGLED